MHRLLVASLIALSITPGIAQDTVVPVPLEKRGPAIGERIPDFEAVDQFGKRHTPSTLMGKRGLVLLFVRSADW